MVAVALVLLAACSPSAPVPPSGLPTSFPSDFPLPSGAVVTNSSDAVALQVANTTMEELEAFYRERLPEKGWTVLESWDGQDPQGRATSGLVIEQVEGTSGALAFTPTEGGAVLLRVNLEQPNVPPSDP